MTQATIPAITHNLAGTWTIDPSHSEVSFTIRHLMTKVRGHFTEFNGTITADPANPLGSSAHAVIQMASIDTRSEMRDNHMRSPEVFDVANYPTMTFVSTGVTPLSGEKFELHGELTIKGVTRTVTLDAEFLGEQIDPANELRVGFTATATVSRKDFGIEFNVPLSGERLLLSDEVAITLELQATKAE